MSYLIPNDYKKQIQDVNLQQVITSDLTILSAAQLAAQAEAVSYLRQKYDTSVEFSDLNAWSPLKVYNVRDRVYLDAVTYSSTTSYTINNLCLYNGVVFICTAATTGSFDLTKWTALGSQYSIFSVVYPYPLFDYTAYYNVGDMVYWKGYTYKALVQTPLLDHDTLLQYDRIEAIPLNNIAPDDTKDGAAQYWGTKTAYTIAAGTLPTNPVWLMTDNRDQQMVMYLIDLTLYHVHTRIAPRNIPELRVKRYDDAICWLKMCAKGEVTPALPIIQPKQGQRIRYGGNIKIINSF